MRYNEIKGSETTEHNGRITNEIFLGNIVKKH